MADGSDLERTEEPTPKRRQEARDEGRIPRSPELTTAVVLVGSALVLAALAGGTASRMFAVFASSLAAAGTMLDANGAVAVMRALAIETGSAVLPLLAAMSAVALVVAAGQARGVVSLKPITPDFGRINPAKNGKRMLGAQPWVELGKSLLKLVLIGLAVRGALRAAWPEVIALAQQSPAGLLEVIRRYGVRVLLHAGLAYLVIAGIDYAWQLWQHEKSLKMTKEELKLELKQSEGDPMVKQRMRSIARSLARKRMMQDVPKADVVITNPTHIAVALLYDPDTAPAPVVLAMGQRKIAQRIKQLAFEHDVPVIENKPLARALLAGATVGQMIPAELYLAVAEVLAFVLRQRAMAPSRWRGEATA
jgi:flagellar biosynthetic protein FlhB